LINIGNSPVQEIYVDAEVEFKTRKPLGNKYLPIHHYVFIDFLSPSTENSNYSKRETIVSFDNFVAREIITDFFEGRTNYNGGPFLPNQKEMKDSSLWSSPKIKIECLYSDIQKNYYCSEMQLFFHIYKDPTDGNKLKLNLLNDSEINFLGFSKISSKKMQKHFKINRHLRYTAFFGESFEKNELVVVGVKWEKN
jgi:hypothetical protein